MKKIIGIDLGTSNTFIYVDGRGVVFSEPTIVALNSKTKQTVEVGYLASKMIGRVSDDIEIIRPMKRGVIARINPTIKFLREAFKRANIKSVKNTTLLFSVPSDITPVERNAYLDVGKAFEVEDVVFANEARLGALGSGTSSKEIKGSLHINLGGGSTSIVVSSGKDILVSRSSYFCGNLIDEAIMRYLRKERHLMIGEKSAEFIKMKIGSLEFTPENRLLEVPGRDILTSLPHNVTISTNEVRSVILPLAEQLMNHINDVLIVTPPEIASDIQENGVVISGGTALLTGMREYIEKQINLPVRIAPDPIACVANGMRTYIKELLNN